MRLVSPQASLRPAAYEALMEMIKNSPEDCYETVQHTTLVILERFRATLCMEWVRLGPKNPGDRSQFNELQSSLCATLQSLLRKGDFLASLTRHSDRIKQDASMCVPPVDAPIISDAVIEALLPTLTGSGGKSGGVQEVALKAISTLTAVMGEGFLKCMDFFRPYLNIALQNFSDNAVSHFFSFVFCPKYYFIRLIIFLPEILTKSVRTESQKCPNPFMPEILPKSVRTENEKCTNTFLPEILTKL